MSKQDPTRLPPSSQYAYGAPLQQQYGSQPPPYSATPTAPDPYSAQMQAGNPYGAQLSQVQMQAQSAPSPYMQQQYLAQMQQLQQAQQLSQLPHGYVAAPSSAYPRQHYMPMVTPQEMVPQQGAPPPYSPAAQTMIIRQPPNVVVGGSFDSGARFDGVGQPRIPPPPPGVAPNAAQLASMQGGTVIASQQRSNWFTG